MAEKRFFGQIEARFLDGRPTDIRGIYGPTPAAVEKAARAIENYYMNVPACYFIIYHDAVEVKNAE